ncbi:hypothetical protein NKH18_18380 [Streptomyces sp. M10(2022)]
MTTDVTFVGKQVRFEQFVRTEGAVYAFTPSMSTLDRLADGKLSEDGPRIRSASRTTATTRSPRSPRSCWGRGRCGQGEADAAGRRQARRLRRAGRSPLGLEQPGHQGRPCRLPGGRQPRHLHAGQPGGMGVGDRRQPGRDARRPGRRQRGDLQQRGHRCLEHQDPALTRRPDTGGTDRGRTGGLFHPRSVANGAVAGRADPAPVGRASVLGRAR